MVVGVGEMLLRRSADSNTNCFIWTTVVADDQPDNNGVIMDEVIVLIFYNVNMLK